ncbi:hypothetical protein PFAG_00961 [Plasmodium falciparum Santa Lucia]|uniref:Uncharacterized protein n=9 Tax=Plasmodium falciparum TaxID=5833 RepID=W7JZY5_PLAFO|nr:hypothetical protein PFFVO_01007 [Plasmodium falciparum Vietnam Oak-Knoll (FVO)]ETW44533.1 hypothetical protein PFNF135_01101 [Plasmodium falciparum NF135/5.C10]ETW50913.1 hypothetical protein PFMALIP_01072 [Plasmodium falciparum MaliPS096_E11]ETW53530.1 hypothetical protein PFUGPA_04545 [Plasmodium falciparum Palo Alto/Uganda]ETW58033.1 hypothetical protein PFMC_06070 [Plasmodium falciparum CAMP/Malaysia]EUR77417.1 hypothetical protein PFBG_00994 [Plasmodium falciparum 7G8]EUT90604.1 hypo
MLQSSYNKVLKLAKNIYKKTFYTIKCMQNNKEFKKKLKYEEVSFYIQLKGCHIKKDEFNFYIVI